MRVERVLWYIPQDLWTEGCGEDMLARQPRIPQRRQAGRGMWAKPRQDWILTAVSVLLGSNLCPYLFIGDSRPWGTGVWGWPEGKLSHGCTCQCPWVTLSFRVSKNCSVAHFLGLIVWKPLDSKKLMSELWVHGDICRLIPPAEQICSLQLSDHVGWHLWWCHSILGTKSHLNHTLGKKDHYIMFMYQNASKEMISQWGESQELLSPGCQA